MGSSKSKITQKISYKSKFFPNIITIDLSEKFDYPNRPHKEALDQQLKEILTEIQLISEDKDLILNFPKSLKWKLICKHREFVSKNLSSIAEVDKTQAQMMLEKINSTASTSDLQELFKWLRHTSFEDLQAFYDYGGVKSLFDILQVSELCSRNSGNYTKSIF